MKATGDIITVAGNGTAGSSGDGGPATTAELDNPRGLTIDAAGDLVIADFGNSVVREVVNATGDIVTVAGDGTAGYSGDNGPATAAELSGPYGVAFDPAGNLFITDFKKSVVREVVKATGNMITVAGNGMPGYSGDSGPATTAELNGPDDVALDSAGDLFISDAFNNAVREVTPAVTVTVTLPNMLVIQTQPSTLATAGQAFAVQPVVYVEDGNGNLETSDNSTVVTVSLASGTGPIQGKTLSVTVVGGIASFSGLDLGDNTANTITLEFAGDGMTSSPSAPIIVLPATPFRLNIQAQPSPTATAGVPFATQPVIEELDLYGNLETTDNSTPINASVSFGNRPLDGTTTVILSAGVATFRNLADSSIGTIALGFAGGGLSVGPSNQIVINNPGPATQLVVRTQPGATVTAGNVITGPITIDEEDQYGNLESSDNSTVVTATLNSGNGALKGAGSVMMHGGVATFTNLEVDTAGPITLTFASGKLIPAISGPIRVSPAQATQLVVTTPPPSQLAPGQTFTLVVAAEDPFNNVDSTYSGNVTVALAGDSGFGTTVVAKNGLATFVGLSVSAGDQGGSIQVTAPRLTSTGTAPISVTAGQEPPLIIGEQPVTQPKQNRRGKPKGKPMLIGYQLDFSAALNTATGDNAVSYQMTETTIKKAGKKKIVQHTPVRLKPAYNANSVTLKILGKPTFPDGGTLTVSYELSGQGSGSNPQPPIAEVVLFTISPKGTAITPA